MNLLEGVYDPGILKAVFLAGGPGSGKSYSVNQIFGIDDIIRSGIVKEYIIAKMQLGF